MSANLAESFQWSIFIESLGDKIESLSIESWLKPLEFDTITTETLYLLAPSNFVKQWVLENYKNIILEGLKAYNINDLEIGLQHNTSSAQSNIAEPINLPLFADTAEAERVERFKLSTKYTFENFVVGTSNEFAYNAAKRFASNDPLEFNTLFLYGASGLGKTHLMHSIAWELINNHSSKKYLYLTAERFMHMFINALNSKSILSFKDTMRNVDLLMIDDFQFMNGKESTQEEFFHTFNTLISQGKNIVFSADKSPLSLDRIEDRIRSRLQGGLIVNINATTYELRLAILQQKTKQLNVKIPKEVLDYLAHKLTDNIRQLEGALNRLTLYAQSSSTKMTLNLALELLKDEISHLNKAVDIFIVQQRVAEFYKIKIADLISTKRDKDTSLARQVAMYIAKNTTKLSLKDIGNKFGGRDHSTVYHAVKKITSDITLNSSLEADIRLLINIVQKS